METVSKGTIEGCREMKKLLLDTTYLLPLVGIAIEGANTKLVQELLSAQEFSILLSEISLFELAAKGAKIALNTTLTYQEVLRGIDTIRHEKRFKLIGWTSNPAILELSYKIRTVHSDFIDSLILATAVCTADTFASYDKDLITKMMKEKEIITEIEKVNPNLRVWFNNLEKKSLQLKEMKK